MSAAEWACLIPILLLAAADRFVNLPARGVWDSDQGSEVGAIWNAVVTRQLPTFGPPAYSVGGLFHHGALFYDLMIPFAWAGNGNPTLMVVAIALFGFGVVPLVWWTARSIGGPSAGLATALLAAVSPSLIDYSTFIWNPVLSQAGVALACLGAWQAWTTRGPRWWVVAAAGTAVASQAHLTGLVLVFPMSLFFLVTLRRSAPAERPRLVAWGLAAVGLFVLTWMPWLVSEFTHNFAETRGILAFRQAETIATAPPIGFLVSTIRILAWPLTHWPLSDLRAGFPAALAVAAGVAAGMLWRVLGAVAPAKTRASTGPASGDSLGPASGVDGPEETALPSSRAARIEREGLLFVGGSLLLIVTLLGLAVRDLWQVESVNEEQYHVVADVFVILAAGLVVSGIWRSAPLRHRPWSGRVLASLALVGLVAVGVSHWPPLTAPDGGWPAAQAAATRLERDAGSQELALVPLPDFKAADAYAYPLELDGVQIVAPAGARVVVILCDTGWWNGCGGTAETDWMASNLPGRDFTLVDRWEPAPERVLSVYRLAP